MKESSQDPPCEGFYSLEPEKMAIVDNTYSALVVEVAGSGTELPNYMQQCMMYTHLVKDLGDKASSRLDAHDVRTTLIHIILCQIASFSSSDWVKQFTENMKAWWHKDIVKGTQHAVHPFRLNESGRSCENAVRSNKVVMDGVPPSDYAPVTHSNPAPAPQPQDRLFDFNALSIHPGLQPRHDRLIKMVRPRVFSLKHELLPVSLEKVLLYISTILKENPRDLHDGDALFNHLIPVHWLEISILSVSMDTINANGKRRRGLEEVVKVAGTDEMTSKQFHNFCTRTTVFQDYGAVNMGLFVSWYIERWVKEPAMRRNHFFEDLVRVFLCEMGSTMMQFWASSRDQGEDTRKDEAGLEEMR
jgi:hypothetical protein